MGYKQQKGAFARSCDIVTERDFAHPKDHYFERVVYAANRRAALFTAGRPFICRAQVSATVIRLLGT